MAECMRRGKNTNSLYTPTLPTPPTRPPLGGALPHGGGMTRRGRKAAARTQIPLYFFHDATLALDRATPYLAARLDQNPHSGGFDFCPSTTCIVIA